MFNRATLVGRALQSCLCQSFADFEVVVVDDGSSDGSYDVVSNFHDSRIRLLRHAENKGVCPARNTAISNASGQWVICLDSDDELLADALQTMYRRTAAAPPEISNVRFMCRFDSGELSPDPPFRGEVLDYQGYIRWLEVASRGRHEAMVCLRRSVFERVSFPDNRAVETLFHLELAKRFLTLDCPEVVRLYHQDANNSLCARFSGERLLELAPDQTAMHEMLLRSHGNALRNYAPSLFMAELKAAATFAFLCGNRRKGARYSLYCLTINPLSPGMIAVLACGLFGPMAVVFAKWIMAEVRRSGHSAHSGVS
jgi:glycosyltransferase involved in cell wall biosynthesis